MNYVSAHTYTHKQIYKEVGFELMCEAKCLERNNANFMVKLKLCEAQILHC